MIDIVPILEHYGADYVPEGRNRTMRCPFHDDHVKSGSVDTDKGLYVCFTCSASGDAISLVMFKEGLDFVAAKREAERLAGDGGEVRGGAPREPGGYLPRNTGVRRDKRAWRASWHGGGPTE